MPKETGFTKKEAYLKLASYCAYQERCESEVRTKLLAIGIRGYEIQELVDLLKEENFLNEGRFAKQFATGKFRVKKWGKMKISQALMQKGVADNYIHEGLEEIDEQEYLDTLYQLLVKKWDSLQEVDLYKKKGKAFNYAVSKGFEPHVIWEVINELVG
ncbi:MAG: regulatory protein RecX [Flammeovirgaceae bacterium]